MFEVAPKARTIRQKIRPLRAEKKDVAGEKVTKLPQARFICQVRYPA